MSRLETFVGVFSVRGRQTSSAFVSTANIGYYILLFAHTSNLVTSLNASNDSRIIDSDASDHMTDISSMFSSYNLCSGRQKVKIVDGSLSSVSGKGSIHVTTSLSLSFVLHIPYFAANLLFITRITY
jgi:hypothetical protein